MRLRGQSAQADIVWFQRRIHSLWKGASGSVLSARSPRRRTLRCSSRGFNRPGAQLPVSRPPQLVDDSPPLQRACLYIMSTSSSYMESAAWVSSLVMAAAAQCLRWLRISSRPTLRSASCTEEICVMTSAQ